jgi:hypothetical protein
MGEGDGEREVEEIIAMYKRGWAGRPRLAAGRAQRVKERLAMKHEK